MVSRSLARAFRNIFRKSLDSNERSEIGDTSLDASLMGQFETNESQKYEKEERIEYDLSKSYFSNVQPRTSILKKYNNLEENKAGTSNEMTANNIIEKEETLKQHIFSDSKLRGEEKMSTVTQASTVQESPTVESEEDSGPSVIPDSQDTEKIFPDRCAPSRIKEVRDGESSSESECSFDSSPKGIYDLCESQPKFIEQKNGEGAEKVGNVDENRVQTRASALLAASNSQSKRESIDEELGTIILNKRVTQKKMKVSNESKACKSKRKEPEPKSDMLIRLRLPISGSSRKKLFAIKLSRLISIVSNKRHPLNKLAGKLSMENFNFLTDNELKILIKILSHFVCVKVVRR